jgi:hypothetical protein
MGCGEPGPPGLSVHSAVAQANRSGIASATIPSRPTVDVIVNLALGKKRKFAIPTTVQVYFLHKHTEILRYCTDTSTIKAISILKSLDIALRPVLLQP